MICCYDDWNMNDLTIIYYTANCISDYFMANTQKQLLARLGTRRRRYLIE